MLDELKTAWKAYDKKIDSSRRLSEQLIISMIKEKSQSRLSTVKRNYQLGMLYMTTWFVLGIVIILTNPFDFERTTEYLPVAIYSCCILILAGSMLKINLQLRKVEISNSNLQEALQRIITILKKYNKPGQFRRLILKILLGTAILFPMSFLERKVEQKGLAQGILEILLAMGISAVLILLAYRFGFFKEKNNTRFEEYHRELEELRALSDELAKD